MTPIQATNRPFEFRAWHPPTQTMYSVWALLNENIEIDLPEGKTEADYPVPHGIIPLNELAVMQFTGLHAKDGAKIWEGDILRDDIDPEDPGFLYVCFQGGSFRLLAPDETVYKKYDSHLLTEFTDTTTGLIDCTVVGNIYESPELLGISSRTTLTEPTNEHLLAKTNG